MAELGEICREKRVRLEEKNTKRNSVSLQRRSLVQNVGCEDVDGEQ